MTWRFSQLDLFTRIANTDAVYIISSYQKFTLFVCQLKFDMVKRFTKIMYMKKHSKLYIVIHTTQECQRYYDDDNIMWIYIWCFT